MPSGFFFCTNQPPSTTHHQPSQARTPTLRQLVQTLLPPLRLPNHQRLLAINLRHLIRPAQSARAAVPLTARPPSAHRPHAVHIRPRAHRADRPRTVAHIHPAVRDPPRVRPRQIPAVAAGPVHAALVQLHGAPLSPLLPHPPHHPDRNQQRAAHARAHAHPDRRHRAQALLLRRAARRLARRGTSSRSSRGGGRRNLGRHRRRARDRRRVPRPRRLRRGAARLVRARGGLRRRRLGVGVERLHGGGVARRRGYERAEDGGGRGAAPRLLGGGFAAELARRGEALGVALPDLHAVEAEVEG